jgi:hypothetical protein
VLNRHGRVQVYDHEFARHSRRELLQYLKLQSEDHPTAQRVRRAMKFFDKIGWVTPLKLKEQASQQ